MKNLLLSLIVALCSLPAFANQAAHGWCEQGSTVVVTAGLNSTTPVQGSFPSCTVTVNIHGGGPATIFSDNIGTPLANPFFAGTNGQWTWYAANGHYDVVLTGGGLSGPVTFSDILLNDSSLLAGSTCTVAFTATPTFNASTCAMFSMTLTGNVTSSTIVGGGSGQLLAISLTQSGGPWTFAWPGTVSNPPILTPTAGATENFFLVQLVDTNWHVVGMGEYPWNQIDALTGTGNVNVMQQAPTINSPTLTGTTTSGAIVASGVISANPGYQIAGAAASGRYLKGDGTNFVQSAGPAGGAGSCTNQFVRAVNADASPTCNTVTSTDVDTTIAKTGVDINTSNQVTATHISGVTTNVLQKASATGNMINSSITDDGTTVSFTEPLLMPGAGFISFGIGGPGISNNGGVLSVGTSQGASNTNVQLRSVGITGSTSGVVNLTTDATATKLTVSTPIDATTGYRIANAAAANQALIGNGTNFVSTALSLTSAQFANQGTTTTVLHGNAAGNPSFAGVSLTADTSANQGTTTTVLHGNAAGQPSFASVTSSDCPTCVVNNAANTGTSSFKLDMSSSAANDSLRIPVINAGAPTVVGNIVFDSAGGGGYKAGFGGTTSRITFDDQTAQLTQKRVTPRIITMADATSVTPTSDTADENIFVSTQAAGTLTVNAPSGTPTDGQKLILRLKSTNAQTYSFNATYAFSTTVTAPTTLAAGKTDYIGLIWNNTNTKWDVVAVDQGH